MKVLFLSQGKTVNDHPGWHNALEKLKEEKYILDFVNIPFYGYAEKYGWNAFYSEVVNQCKNKDYQIVYFHHFHNRKIPSPHKCFETILNLSKRPIIITSTGDGFSDNWMMRHYPKNFKEASRISDITFSTQMGKAADKMVKWGAKNIVFSPNSMCQVRFNAGKIDDRKHNFTYDLVFIASYNRKMFNPFSQHWYRSKDRKRLVKLLVKTYHNRLGLFGKGWDYDISKGAIPFNEQQNYFRQGRVLVGGTPYSYSDYYTSNRVFFEVSSGVPTIEVLTPRFDKVLRNNHHCYFINNIDDVVNVCDKLLSADPKKLYKKAEIAAKYIEEKHTQYHRMKFKIDTVKRYIHNDFKLDVEFPFFLPEIDLKEEMKYAVRADSVQ